MTDRTSVIKDVASFQISKTRGSGNSNGKPGDKRYLPIVMAMAEAEIKSQQTDACELDSAHEFGVLTAMTIIGTIIYPKDTFPPTGSTTLFSSHR